MAGCSMLLLWNMRCTGECAESSPAELPMVEDRYRCCEACGPQRLAGVLGVCLVCEVYFFRHPVLLGRLWSRQRPAAAILYVLAEHADSELAALALWRDLRTRSLEYDQRDTLGHHICSHTAQALLASAAQRCFAQSHAMLTSVYCIQVTPARMAGLTGAEPSASFTARDPQDTSQVCSASIGQSTNTCLRASGLALLSQSPHAQVRVC